LHAIEHTIFRAKHGHGPVMGAALPALDDSRLLLPVALDALIGSDVGWRLAFIRA
jgi:hypothetical protein